MIYFGYGANVSPEMMEAIIGRLPAGQPAKLHDFELVIQQGAQIKEAVRQTLGRGRSTEEVDSFRTYAIRPQAGAVVEGIAWQITPSEREFIDYWEINDGRWYQKIEVKVDVDGEAAAATTEMIDDPSLALASTLEPSLPVFLNAKDRMLAVARLVHDDYLAK